MLLTLFDNNDNPKLEFSPADSSTQVKELQADNVLSLSFVHYDYVSIDVNDYVDFLGERYWVMQQYIPSQQSNRKWKYDVRLYGIESLIKRYLVLDNTEGDNNAEFPLTAPASMHLTLIVNSINAGLGSTVFRVGEVVQTDKLVLEYSGTYCDEGLRNLAEKAGTEYWFDGTIVNLCRCEHGEEITLGYGAGLTSITPDTAKNTKFYTRLFPLGSKRNIDPSRYGHTRLQLPEGASYVDVNVGKFGVIHHFEEAAFAHIYPRRIGTISSVRSTEATDESGANFTIYYFKDSSLNFNPNDYMLPGEVIRVSFQEGSELAGLGTSDDHYFEVNYNVSDQEFEIITIWPDGVDQLPGGLLVPQVGDRYILWNMRMPDEYYTAAELEFREAVDAYNAENARDITMFKCPTDHEWIERNGIDLLLGQRVKLQSLTYFNETGYHCSRITKITRKVNLPSQMDLEIGDALSRTAQGAFRQQYSQALTDINSRIAGAKSSAGDALDAAGGIGAIARSARQIAWVKRRVFEVQPVPPYDRGDLWVNATFPAGNGEADADHGKYVNDLLKCVTSKGANGTFSINDWTLASRYTDDSVINAFIGQYGDLLAGLPDDLEDLEEGVLQVWNKADDAKAKADTFDYLSQALLDNSGNQQTTDIIGGLVLSTIVALRDAGGKVWSGISGAFDEDKLGNGIAAWYGGGMVDHEAYPNAGNYAKSLFRFDGSGYVAGGNLSWDKDGQVTIQGYQIQVGGSNVATANDLTAYLPLSAGDNKKLKGTLYSQTIVPKTHNTYSLGSTSLWWKNLLIKRIYFVKPNSDNDTGAVYLEYDSTNLGLHIVGAGLYSDSYISALGANSQGGGGGGVELSAVWQSLTINTDEYGTSKIHIDHIPNLSNLTLSYGKIGAVASSEVYNGKTTKTVYIPQKLSDLSDGANIVTNVAVGTGTHANELAITKNGETSYTTVPFATKAAQWNTSRSFTIKDSDQSNSGTAASVNGTAAVTLLLPSTIKATLVGNADTATKATQDGNGNNIANTYATKTSLQGYATGLAVGTGNNSTKITVVKNGSADANGYITVPFATNSTNAASSTGLVSTTMPSGANYDDYRSFTDCRVYDNTDSLENIPNIGKYSTLVSMGKYLRTFQIRADHYSTFLAYRVLQDNGAGSPQRFVFTDWRQILHSDYAILNNNVTLRWKDNGGTDLNCLNLSANNELGIGYETSAQGYSTYIDGAAIYLRYGAEHVKGLSIAGSGAVTIANVLSANGGIVVPASKSIKIGTIVLEDDNGLLKVWDGTGNAVKGIYATGTVSALGANTSGGGGTGIEMPQVWEALAQAGNGEPINITHLQAALTSNGYMHSFSKTSPAGANVVTDVNYNSSTGTLSVTRGSLAMNALAPRDIPSTLATFYDGDNLIYTRAGGNNTVEDKPVNVDSFGVITMRTAAGYYGQILYSTADGHIYYRSAATSSLGGTAWNTLLGSLNYKSYTYDKTATYNRNMVLASSASADGKTASFRQLDAADIPSLPAEKIGSGTFDKAIIPDLSSLYVPISAKWWGQSISNGAVSGNMSNVGTVTFNKSTGNRQLIISPGRGMTMNASTGGWVMSMGTKNNAGTTDLEQIGILGSADTITYSYVGGTYDSPSLVVLGNAYASGITSQEGFVGIGTKTPSARLHVNGKTRISYDGASGNENLTLQSSNTDATYNCMSYIKVGTNGVNWSAGINANGYYLWSGKSGVGQCFLVTNYGQTQVKSLKIGTITLTDDNGLLRIDKGVYSLGTVSALGANNNSSGGGGADIVDVWDALARPDSSKLIDSSHINISVLGSGNAFTGITKSGTSITLNKGISFLPLTGNNAANTPVTGDVNFDNDISLKWKKSSGSTAYSVLCLDGSNQLMLGLATAGQSCDTKIYGNNIYLNYGVSGTTGITLASGGNVTIANNLTVRGTSTLTGAVTASSTITATGNITGASIIKKNGTSTQFLKADGSVDESTYLKASDTDLFSTLTSTSAINLTVKVGNTTKTITNLYANYLNDNPWHWYMKRGSVYTGNVSGARWMKAASFETSTDFSSSHYSEIVLAVNDFTSSEQVGILSVCYGREPNATAPRTPYVYAKWIVKTKAIDTDRFVLAYDFSYTSSTATSKAYLYVKMTGKWQQFSFTKISETGWNGNANIWVLNTGDTTSAYSYTDIPETNQVVSADITYASNAGMLNGVAASGYVTIAGTQKISGFKTFDVDTFAVNGGEVYDNENRSQIRFRALGNSTYYKYDNSAVVNSLSALRNGLEFRWYDTAWMIGNIRGGGTDSYGFGFGCRFSNNGNVLDRFHITTMGEAYVATSLYAGSEVTASSDERLKDVVNVTTLTVNDIADAPAIKFLWKDKRDEKVHIGSIAQYWEKALPEAVSYDEKGIMSLNYGALALVSAITIARDLMRYEDRLVKLEKKNVRLERRISALERRIA